MTDVEFQALIEEVRRENIMIESDLAKYGEPQYNPRTEAYLALSGELERRRKEREQRG